MYINENGQFIDQNQDLVKGNEVANLLDKYGLNWTVEKQPLSLPSGLVTDYYAAVRTDIEQPFGTFKEGYEVYQNEELANLVMSVADTIGTLPSNGGMFKNGARVYLQLDLEDKKVANDRVRRWATAINSFDGSSSVKWGSSSITVSCSNSFMAAHKQLQQSVRHTANMREAIDNSLRILENIEESEITLFETFNRMADRPITQGDLNSVIQTITKVDVTKTHAEAKKDYSTKALNNTRSLVKSLSKEMSYKGENLWGLFSGVSHFTTHVSGTEKSRAESKMMGNLQKIDQTVFEELAELVS
jgi:hypothetical protein